MPGGLYPPAAIFLQWQSQIDSEQLIEQRGWELVVIAGALYTVVLCVLLARLWARLKFRDQAGLDDVFIFFAFIPTTALALAVSLGVKLYGFDRHVWNLTSDMIISSRKLTFIIVLCYIWSTGLTKISILLFYRRLACGTVTKWFQNLTRAVIAFVAAYVLACTLTMFLGCRPFNAFWNSPDPRWARVHERGVDWQCFDEGASDIAASCISVFQDFLTCGLPTLLFWKLQMPKRQKLALAAIFGVGLCITGVFRIYYTYRTFYNTYDVTWAAYDAWLWTIVEAHLAIACASAPALKVFFARFFQVAGAVGIQCPRQVFKAWRHEREVKRLSLCTEVKVTRYTDRSGGVAAKTTRSPGVDLDGRSGSCKYLPVDRHDIEMGCILVEKETEVSSSRNSTISAPEKSTNRPQSAPRKAMGEPDSSRGGTSKDVPQKAHADARVDLPTPWTIHEVSDVEDDASSTCDQHPCGWKNMIREELSCM